MRPVYSATAPLLPLTEKVAFSARAGLLGDLPVSVASQSPVETESYSMVPLFLLVVSKVLSLLRATWRSL